MWIKKSTATKKVVAKPLEKWHPKATSKDQSKYHLHRVIQEGLLKFLELLTNVAQVDLSDRKWIHHHNK